MKKILLALKQPYPYHNYTEKLPANAVIIVISVFLFLLLFSPFSVNETEHRFSYEIICLIHALNAALIYWVFFLFVNSIFKPILNEENWKVYKAILLTAIVLLFIGLGSFLLRPLIYNGPENFSLKHLLDETLNTFLVGTLVYAGFTFYDVNRQLKINRAGASGLGEELEKHNEKTQDEVIYLNVENESYELCLNSFLFAKAEGNYTSFYSYKNYKLVKELKRVTLKSIEEQLVPREPAVIRTHRAYIVNASQIIKMSGNAQGYQLYFDHIDFAVPVSRAMIPAFKRKMEVI